MSNVFTEHKQLRKARQKARLVELERAKNLIKEAYPEMPVLISGEKDEFPVLQFTVNDQAYLVSTFSNGFCFMSEDREANTITTTIDPQLVRVADFMASYMDWRDL